MYDVSMAGVQAKDIPMHTMCFPSICVPFSLGIC